MELAASKPRSRTNSSSSMEFSRKRWTAKDSFFIPSPDRTSQRPAFSPGETITMRRRDQLSSSRMPFLSIRKVLETPLPMLPIASPRFLLSDQVYQTTSLPISPPTSVSFPPRRATCLPSIGPFSTKGLTYPKTYSVLPTERRVR